ncbi:MAG: IgGFc-binding protein [Myxococcales bacterium]|nr:IgGFc-binding protein [Myxococcales bacterium]
MRLHARPTRHTTHIICLSLIVGLVMGACGNTQPNQPAVTDTGLVITPGADATDTATAAVTDTATSGSADTSKAADTVTPAPDTSAPAADVAEDTGPIGTHTCQKASGCKGFTQTPYCALLQGYCVECITNLHCSKTTGNCENYKCTDIKCVPGSSVCKNGFVSICKADGKTWDYKTCPDNTPHCVAGKCALCQPNQTFCAPPPNPNLPSKSVLKCNGTGGDADFVMACSGSTTCIDGKCQLCTPALQKCDGQKALRCKDDGSGWAVKSDCGAKGLACLSGLCVDPCGADFKSNTAVGCDYWAVDLDNAQVPCGAKLCDAQNMQYSLIVSNTKLKPATVTVTTGAGKSAKYLVPSGDLQIINLPGGALGGKPLNIDGSGISTNAYRIQSNVPIVAYQFNPLQNYDVFSNDASLLLPTNALGKEYFAMSRQQNFNNLRGYVTIVATAAGKTNVTVQPTCKTLPGKGIPALTKGQIAQVSLSQGEVLNIETNEIGADLTGTWIKADKPISVFGGSEGANVPDTNKCVIAKGAKQGTCAHQGWPCTTNQDCPVTCCADHLEEQLIPVSSWGTTYVASKLKPRGKEKDVWRVLASQDGTQINTDPPQGVIPVLKKGEFFEFESKGDFVMLASKPISVGQFMASANAPNANNDTCSAKFSGSKVCGYHMNQLGEPIMCTSNATCPNIKEAGDAKIGDPAFILAMPTDRYLKEYVVLVPKNYKESYINIVGPANAQVLVDNQAVNPSTWSIFSGGKWKATRMAMKPGTHKVKASVPVGLLVYGYDNYVSYGFPGGMALK